MRRRCGGVEPDNHLDPFRVQRHGAAADSVRNARLGTADARGHRDRSPAVSRSVTPAADPLRSWRRLAGRSITLLRCTGPPTVKPAQQGEFKGGGHGLV